MVDSDAVGERLHEHVRTNDMVARMGAEVFRSEGIGIIRTPIRSPQANAFAERCVKTLRHEALDWTLILGRRHLDRVLASYARHYNTERPHRGIESRHPAGHCHCRSSHSSTRATPARSSGVAASARLS
jgi:hypothetical protein